MNDYVLHQTLDEDLQLYDSSLEAQLAQALQAKATLDGLQSQAGNIRELENQIAERNAHEHAKRNTEKATLKAAGLLSAALTDLSRFKLTLINIVPMVKKLAVLARKSQEKIRQAELEVSQAADDLAWADTIGDYQNTHDERDRRNLVAAAAEQAQREYGRIWRDLGGMDPLLAQSPGLKDAPPEEIQIFDLAMNFAGIVALYNPAQPMKPKVK